MNNDSNKITITSDDIKDVCVPALGPSITNPPNIPGPKVRPGNTVSTEVSGVNILLKSWVYLGIAGLIGAFLAWALCEPSFVDGGEARWGNILLFPLLVTAISIAFATAESFVERSVQKALLRGLLALLLGIVFGFVFYFVANVIYSIGREIIASSGGKLEPENPALWLVRAIAWMAFGVSGGIVYGIAGKSGKKCLYGMLGGMLGAGIGGLCFDPISLFASGAAPSRCIGMMIFGASTGIAIGLVESALKNRWLYVSGGPLAGKQFILYKPITQLGSRQTNDIFLFKDLSIAATHATIELRGPHTTLLATGATFVDGQPVTQRVLRSGDTIQIGRYTFQYQEKQAQS